MTTISTTLQNTQPRISANQIGEFAFATPERKKAIVRDHMFGNPHTAPYYHQALCAVLRSFKFGRYDGAELMRAAHEIASQKPRTSNHATRLANNAAMLRHFLDMLPGANPPSGVHRVVRRNAFIPLDGVIISVRPEIQTHDALSRRFSFTKLRFSKNKVSADASEIILLVLIKFGQRQESVSFTFERENTMLVDCHSRTIFRGHLIPKLRERQLALALREYRLLWSQIERSEGGGQRRSAAG